MGVIGDNSEGFANEKAIIDYINKTIVFEKFNSNFKSFLSFLFNQDCHGKSFIAKKGKSGAKCDVVISCDSVEKYVSVKTGCGNSVHQEKISVFENFLMQSNVSKQNINDLLLFHFGDGTIDGTGSIRISGNDFIKKNPSKIIRINTFFNDQALLKILIDRFIFVGNIKANQDVDIVYHGTINNGKWASRIELTNLLLSKKIANNKSIHISNMTYQVWNRDLKRNVNTESRRFVMQIKYPSIFKDLELITKNRVDDINKNVGTMQGDIEENDCVSLFNKSKRNSIFADYLKIFNGRNIDELFMVRVTEKKYSKLSNQKVMARADAFLIQSNDAKLPELLHRNNSYLDEKMLQDNSIVFEYVPFSGVSIKLSDSTNYQILKMTVESFKKIIGYYELGAGASLFCTKIEELKKNKDLIIGWKTSVSAMKEYFKLMNLSDDFYLNIDTCKNIKILSNKMITTIINSDEGIKRKIFNGKGLYDEPFTAYHLFKNKELSLLDYIPFTITTGSGRSKGNYSIELKPKKES